jgi:branched-subunit amino acid transport protein
MMSYIIASFAVIIISGFAHFFPQYYVSELVVSFLPYIIFLLLTGLILSLVFVRKHLRARR